MYQEILLDGYLKLGLFLDMHDADSQAQIRSDLLTCLLPIYPYPIYPICDFAQAPNILLMNEVTIWKYFAPTHSLFQTGTNQQSSVGKHILGSSGWIHSRTNTEGHLKSDLGVRSLHYSGRGKQTDREKVKAFTCFSKSAPYQRLHDCLLHISPGFLAGTKKRGRKRWSACRMANAESKSALNQWLPFWGQRSVLREPKWNNH